MADSTVEPICNLAIIALGATMQLAATWLLFAAPCGAHFDFRTRRWHVAGLESPERDGDNRHRVMSTLDVAPTFGGLANFDHNVLDGPAGPCEPCGARPPNLPTTASAGTPA